MIHYLELLKYVCALHWIPFFTFEFKPCFTDNLSQTFSLPSFFLLFFFFFFSRNNTWISCHAGYFTVFTSHFVYFGSRPSCVVQVVYNQLADAWGMRVSAHGFMKNCFALPEANIYTVTSQLGGGSNISGNSWDWYVLESWIHFIKSNKFGVCCGQTFCCMLQWWIPHIICRGGSCYSTSSAQERIINDNIVG